MTLKSSKFIRIIEIIENIVMSDEKVVVFSQTLKPLEILREEIMKRFDNIEVVGEPSRIRSSFVKGYADLPVIIH